MRYHWVEDELRSGQLQAQAAGWFFARRTSSSSGQAELHGVVMASAESSGVRGLGRDLGEGREGETP